MKKLFASVALALLAGSGMAVFAADETSKPSAVAVKPNMFGSSEECRVALKSANFGEYEPKFFNRRGENPPDGVRRVRGPLPADACVHLETSVGWRWVVQKKGTVYRFHAENGKQISTKPYARDDCGNPAGDIAYLSDEIQKRDASKPPVTLPAKPAAEKKGPQPLGPPTVIYFTPREKVVEVVVEVVYEAQPPPPARPVVYTTPAPVYAVAPAYYYPAYYPPVYYYRPWFGVHFRDHHRRDRATPSPSGGAPTIRFQ